MHLPAIRTAFAFAARTRGSALALHTTTARLAARTLATTSSYLDIATEIKLDHDNVRDLFDRYEQATDIDHKMALANTLIREMAIHADAEELSVYNNYAAVGLAHAATYNKEEHEEIKSLVYDVDASRITHAEYDAVLARAVSTFISHAMEEEELQLPLIQRKLNAKDNDRLARAFLKARTTIPTRPHPWAPQIGAFAQKAASMRGLFNDKVVETIEGREFVNLKYQHPAEF